MAKIGYTRKPDGQNRVPLSTLVQGRHLIGQRPPRPDSGRTSNGSTRFYLLTPPSTTRFQSHLPDCRRAICTLFIFLRAKKVLHQLKNTLLWRLPNMTRWDVSRCRLFSGGFVHSFKKHLWYYLIHVLLSKFSSGQRLSRLLWSQWLQCVDRWWSHHHLVFFRCRLFHGVR